jgi:hypothetical protein
LCQHADACSGKPVGAVLGDQPKYRCTVAHLDRAQVLSGLSERFQVKVE